MSLKPDPFVSESSGPSRDCSNDIIKEYGRHPSRVYVSVEGLYIVTEESARTLNASKKGNAKLESWLKRMPAENIDGIGKNM